MRRVTQRDAGHGWITQVRFDTSRKPYLRLHHGYGRPESELLFEEAMDQRFQAGDAFRTYPAFDLRRAMELGDLQIGALALAFTPGELVQDLIGLFKLGRIADMLAHQAGNPVLSFVQPPFQIHISALTVIQLLLAPSHRLAKLICTPYGFDQAAFLKPLSEREFVLNTTFSSMHGRQALSKREIESLAYFLRHDPLHMNTAMFYYSVRNEAGLTLPPIGDIVYVDAIGVFHLDQFLVHSVTPFCPSMIDLGICGLTARWIAGQYIEKRLATRRERQNVATVNRDWIDPQSPQRGKNPWTILPDYIPRTIRFGNTGARMPLRLLNTYW